MTIYWPFKILLEHLWIKKKVKQKAQNDDQMGNALI